MSSDDVASGGPGAATLRTDDILYYLHIPKTAGTTFNAVLESYFDRDQIWPVGEIVGEKLAAEIARTPPQVLARYRLIRGHFDYSIHRFLPAPPVYVTMLRHPVDRTRSLYGHIRRVRSHRLHDEMTRGTRGIVDLLEHELAPRRFNDRQTHQIVGTVNDPGPPMSDTELLDKAKHRLQEEFRFFGIAERFDDSLQVLYATLGWRPLSAYRSFNVAPGPPRATAPDHDDRDRAAIEDHNRHDMELYDFACTLFAQRYGAT